MEEYEQENTKSWVFLQPFKVSNMLFLSLLLHLNRGANLNNVLPCYDPEVERQQPKVFPQRDQGTDFCVDLIIKKLINLIW